MDQILDGVIIGAGTAGLTAAIYWKRSSLSFVLLDKGAPGGKLKKQKNVVRSPLKISIKLIITLGSLMFLDPTSPCIFSIKRRI